MVNKGKAFPVFAHTMMILMSLTALLPFLLMVASSFTEEQVLLEYGYGFIPREWSLLAYQYIFNNAASIFRAYGITIFVTVVGTSLGVLSTILLAYPLSMPDMPGRKIVSFLVYFTMLFNGGLVPTYMMYTQVFNIKNTVWALIFPALLVKAFYVIIARSYFSSSLPREILEAARVDGANEFKVLVRFVWPMSVPIIATIALMQGLNYWNDWTNGLYYINDTSLYSIQVLLNRMLSDTKALQMGFEASEALASLPSTSIKMAIAIIGILPILVAYPFFQRYFVKGLTLGAVKG